MDYKVELVAQAIHRAEPAACLWDVEPAIRKERFREYARNAIRLLDDDIGVLLLALRAEAEQWVGSSKSPDASAIVAPK